MWYCILQTLFLHVFRTLGHRDFCISRYVVSAHKLICDVCPTLVSVKFFLTLEAARYIIIEARLSRRVAWLLESNC
jgi:hypothetical protein